MSETEIRPIDEYDLSTLYLLIGMDFLAPHEERLNLVGKTLRQAMWMIVSLCRIIEKLNEEIEQRKGQDLNLEKRIFALEEKTAKKDKYGYY